MKAYKIRIDEDEGFDIVVFAENPSKAKSIAITQDCDINFTDLRVTRYPIVDSFYKEGMSILDMNDVEVQRFLRKEGWYSDCCCSICEECGLSEWENVPESLLDDGICGECRGEVR